MDVKEVTERVLSVVKNFEKVDPAKVCKTHSNMLCQCTHVTTLKIRNGLFPSLILILKTGKKWSIWIAVDQVHSLRVII